LSRKCCGLDVSKPYGPPRPVAEIALHKGAEKSLAFPIFLFAAQPKEISLDGLKKLEQRSLKCMELKGEYVE
jgi:hypothetical protein